MRRRAVWLLGAVLVALGACEPETELSVAEASLLDDATPMEPFSGAPAPTVQTRSAEELRRDALVASITVDNVVERAEALERTLKEEVRQLELRSTPVDVDMGGP